MIEWALDTFYQGDSSRWPISRKGFPADRPDGLRNALLDLMERIVAAYPTLRLFSLPSLVGKSASIWNWASRALRRWSTRRWKKSASRSKSGALPGSGAAVNPAGQIFRQPRMGQSPDGFPGFLPGRNGGLLGRYGLLCGQLRRWRSSWPALAGNAAGSLMLASAMSDSCLAIEVIWSKAWSRRRAWTAWWRRKTRHHRPVRRPWPFDGRFGILGEGAVLGFHDAGDFLLHFGNQVIDAARVAHQLVNVRLGQFAVQLGDGVGILADNSCWALATVLLKNSREAAMFRAVRRSTPLKAVRSRAIATSALAFGRRSVVRYSGCSSSLQFVVWWRG